MRRLVFDIECDGFLPEATRMHLLIARDLDTGDRFAFREGDFGWMQLFDADAKLIVGHNIIDYDLAVLEKLFGYRIRGDIRIHDTLLMSQIQDYRRFGMDGHSLEEWGRFFGMPKLAFNDFSVYSAEMERYCDNDVDLSKRVYEYLFDEYTDFSSENPGLSTFLYNEHKAAIWQQRAQLHGWPVDREAMIVLNLELEAKLAEAEAKLLPQLGFKFKYPDKVKGEVEVKTTSITSKGLYNATAANWLNIPPEEALYDKPIRGAYSRVIATPLKLSYSEDVKLFLYRSGWVPDEWNTRRRPDGKMEKTSPKITEDSLEFLGGDGSLYREYTKVSARHGILKGWLAAIGDGDRLHGDSMLIGTPSMRVRHSVIANIPSPDAAYGKEFRSIFKCLDGWRIVGCDSSGNQARSLAFYLGDPVFIDTLLNGDIHQYNADILTELVRSIAGVPPDFVVTRAMAKRVLYAFLFGASGAKLWTYIFGRADAENGNKLKSGFVKAVPGFQALISRLEGFFGNTKKSGFGWIPSIAGNRIYVDSFHKLLVYLLQACEKATCSAALAMTMRDLEEAKIPYIPLIYYHDEIDFMVPEEHAARAAEIGKNAFKEAPKAYGIDIMDGEAKIGINWLEAH